MRTISTEGAGLEAREGARVTIHLTISQPGEDGELFEVYRSKDTSPILSFIPYTVTSAYALFVMRSRSFCAPVEILPKMICSAARPPRVMAIMSSICSVVCRLMAV